MSDDQSTTQYQSLEQQNAALADSWYDRAQKWFDAALPATLVAVLAEEGKTFSPEDVQIAQERELRILRTALFLAISRLQYYSDEHIELPAWLSPYPGSWFNYLVDLARGAAQRAEEAQLEKRFFPPGSSTNLIELEEPQLLEPQTLSAAAALGKEKEDPDHKSYSEIFSIRKMAVDPHYVMMDTLQEFWFIWRYAQDSHLLIDSLTGQLFRPGEHPSVLLPFFYTYQVRAQISGSRREVRAFIEYVTGNQQARNQGEPPKARSFVHHIVEFNTYPPYHLTLEGRPL
jgi:hypothetical protein